MRVVLYEAILRVEVFDNMAKRQKSLAQPVLPPVSNPDNVRPVYCNNMQVTAGVFDTRITFNEVIKDGDAVFTERRAHIVTSNLHFRAMVKVLSDYAESIKDTIQTAERTILSDK